MPELEVDAALRRNIEAYFCGNDILALDGMWGALERSLTHGKHLELARPSYVKCMWGIFVRAPSAPYTWTARLLIP